MNGRVNERRRAVGTAGPGQAAVSCHADGQEGHEGADVVDLNTQPENM